MFKRWKCRKFELLICDYARGEQSELTPEERRGLEAHLEGCPACREDLALTRRIIEALKAAKKEEEEIAKIEIPDWVIRETDEKVKKAIREFCEESKRKEQVHSGRLLWVPIAAMAAFTVISLWAAVERHWTGQGQGAKPITSEQPVSPEWLAASEQALKLEKDFARLDNPQAALELLQNRFQGSKAKSGAEVSEFFRIAGLCEKLAARWRGSSEAVEARKLMYQCYAEIGETENARAAFLAYAVAQGETAKRKAEYAGANRTAAQREAVRRCAQVLYEHGYSLFGQKDYVEAGFYFDEIRRRTVRSEEAARALYMRGRVYSALGQPVDAIEAYQGVVGESMDELLQREAYRELSTETFNLGQQDKAVRVLEEMAKRCPTYEGKAYALYRAAVLQEARGEKYYPDAVQKLKTIVEKYQRTKHAEPARELLARLEKKVLRDVKLQ